MIFKFFDNLNTILCKQMRFMFTYFSSKLQVSSKIVKTNETCALVATSADSVLSSYLVRITIAPIGTTFGYLQ